MSIFNKLLPQIFAISDAYTNQFNSDLKAALECIGQLEEEFLNGRALARGKSTKIVHLQSINEDEDETAKATEDNPSNNADSGRSSNESTGCRGSKKRSKHEVDGMESPEQEKRQKRNASVKAQSIISKQVNVNLTQKMRRETLDKGKGRRAKEDKENTEPVPVFQIKQEKISLPDVPMEINSIPDETLPSTLVPKQEVHRDDIAMPPPMAPVPKPRRAVQKEKSQDSTDDESSGRKRTTKTKKDDAQTESRNALLKDKSEDSADEESSGRKRTTKNKTDTRTARSSNRTTRASARASKQVDVDEAQLPETRPKRTRAKKVAEAEKENAAEAEIVTGSPAAKPRTKRTRRRKTAEKQPEKAEETTQSESETDISPRDDRVVQTEIQSPILQNNSIKCKTQTIKPQASKTTTYVDPDIIVSNNLNNNETINKAVDKILANKNENLALTDKEIDGNKKENSKLEELKNTNAQDNMVHKGNSKLEEKVDKVNSNKQVEPAADVVDNIGLDETRVLGQLNATVTISTDLDKSAVPPNGTYHHGPDTHKAMYAMNETVVLECNRETLVLDRPQPSIMDTTVVLDRGIGDIMDVKTTNLTDDNSLLTDDSDAVETTPTSKPPVQPTSAVKEKVQQFEEMASRVTRTKTRALAKKDEQPDEQTPPDKPPKAVLSSETLAKMNSLIFNGKPPQVSNSASKPRPIVAGPTKSLIPTNAPKLSAIKAREADELRREREDARKKKEAMLEAKREMQRKKREDKMAAAAAAREAAERERRAAIEAAARERLEKQAHADQGKLVRLKEVERKKQELARKAVETEERRRAEEQARQQRLADEQKRAEAARKKQLEEAEISKKEDVMMQREIERKQKEFMERQRMKHRMESDKMTPYKTNSPNIAMPPTYMLDGFQYLNSDDDDDDGPPNMPIPTWSTSMARRNQLCVQARIASSHIDKLFSVREHTPDLREIFPNIERAHLKRTSSAVWRTPPGRVPVVKK